MANYYSTKIESNKCSQEMAGEIFQKLMNKSRVRDFSFIETGCLSYNTRGLLDISDILERYGISENEISIKDEGDLTPSSLQELKKSYEEIQDVCIEVANICKEAIEEAVNKTDISAILKKYQIN